MSSPFDYTDRQTFAIGDRIELHPSCDLWMRGARFGIITKIYGVAGSIIQIKLDRQRKRVTFPKDQIRHA